MGKVALLGCYIYSIPSYFFLSINPHLFKHSRTSCRAHLFSRHVKVVTQIYRYPRMISNYKSLPTKSAHPRWNINFPFAITIQIVSDLIAIRNSLDTTIIPYNVSLSAINGNTMTVIFSGCHWFYSKEPFNRRRLVTVWANSIEMQVHTTAAVSVS